MFRRISTGVHYKTFMRDYYKRRPPTAYFEIGVNLGHSFRLVDCASVGVDPAFRIREDVVGRKPACHLFQMTSDEFFARHRLDSYLPGGFDIAFLDGMHRFEFLLRDFFNAERYAAPGAVAFLHDCLPINAEMTERERGSTPRQDHEYRMHWTGDVWKLIPILGRYRPDLRVTILDCAPTGLVLVEGLDPRSTRLPYAYDNIMAEYMDQALTDETIGAFYEGLTLVDPATLLEPAAPPAG